MKYNAVVCILPQSTRYRGKLSGKIGTVESTFGSDEMECLYGVRMRDVENPNSAKGLFWFDANDFSVVEADETVKEDNTMVNSHIAEIRFVDETKNKTHFYALYDLDLCPGTLVAVSTGHHGLALAYIVNTFYKGSPEAKLVSCGREVIGKVDRAVYDQEKERQAAEAELKKQKAKLKAAMDARVKELQDTQLIALLAEKDSTLAEMLSQYNALGA